MKPPDGYTSVEHDDQTVHAIDYSTVDGQDDHPHEGMPLWREPVICGSATGVSSDEGGPSALHKLEITCWQCIAILGGDDES